MRPQPHSSCCSPAQRTGAAGSGLFHSSPRSDSAAPAVLLCCLVGLGAKIERCPGRGVVAARTLLPCSGGTGAPGRSLQGSGCGGCGGQWRWGLVLSLPQGHRICQGKEPAGTGPWPLAEDGQDVPEAGAGCGPAINPPLPQAHFVPNLISLKAWCWLPSLLKLLHPSHPPRQSPGRSRWQSWG